MIRWLYDHILGHYNGRGHIWRLRMFVERGLDGYCREDVWSVDCFLAKVLPPMLRELKDSGYTDDIPQDQWNAMYERWAAEWEKLAFVLGDGPDYAILHEFIDHVRSCWS